MCEGKEEHMHVPTDRQFRGFLTPDSAAASNPQALGDTANRAPHQELPICCSRRAPLLCGKLHVKKGLIASADLEKVERAAARHVGTLNSCI